MRIRTISGLTIYALTTTGVAAPTTEGSGLATGWYTVSNADWLASELPSSTTPYDGAFLQGDWNNPAADDPEQGVFSFYWNGSIEYDPAATSGAVSPFTVNKARTWTFPSKNQTTASNILREKIGFNALVAMDFDNQIPQQTSIDSASASFANVAGTEPTVSSTVPSANRRAAHMMIDASSATVGTYTITVAVLTVDGQTFVRSARFEVEAA